MNRDRHRRHSRTCPSQDSDAPLRSPPSWEALRAYILLLRGVFDGLPFGVAMIEAGGDGAVERGALGAASGAARARRRQRPRLARARCGASSPTPRARAAAARRRARSAGAAEFEVTLRDGGALAITATRCRVGDGATVLCFRDATGELHARRELEHRAMHDPLTGLPNRELLMDRLSVALARLGRQGTAVGVLFIDLDGFKEVNDAHGHAVGDELLVSIASRLRREVRDGDTVARYGGDEFVVLCEDLVHLDAAQPLARRLAMRSVSRSAPASACSRSRPASASSSSRTPRPAPRRSSRGPTRRCTA